MATAFHVPDHVSTPALLRHARASYGTAMRTALADAGYDDIPGNGPYVIGAMALGAQGLPLGDVVKGLGVSKQAAGQLVDALVSRGYLLRTVDAVDRRRLTVTLTVRGRAAAAVQTAVRERIDAELLSRVGRKDVDALRRALAALVEIGRRQEADNTAGETPDGR